MDHELHNHHENHSQNKGHKQTIVRDIKDEGHGHHGQSVTATHHGHDKHAGHHTEDFLKRFWICLILTLPVLILSEMIQHWCGFHISFAGDKYVLLALGSIIYFYGGMPFLKGMLGEIRSRAIGM